MDYELTDFATELKALLRKAEDSGLDVEAFCSVAENILEYGWAPIEEA